VVLFFILYLLFFSATVYLCINLFYTLLT